MNARLSADPSMVATATGSGNFGTVTLDSMIGPRNEPMGVSSLQGDMTFTWNKNLQVNGDSVTFSQIYVATNAVPEPTSLVHATMAAFLGLGSWLLYQRRARASRT
jgi:hypothetical protein